MTNLLKKAKGATSQERKAKSITKSDINLALAFLRGEVTPTQVAAAYGRERGQAMYRVAVALRAAYGRGLLH